MAVVKSANTLKLAYELAGRLNGMVVLEDVPAADELLGMLEAIRAESELDKATSSELAWSALEQDSFWGYTSAYGVKASMTGKNLLDAARAQVSAARFESTETQSYDSSSYGYTWADKESGTAKLAPFNPWQDSSFRLLSGTNKWSGGFGNSMGETWEDQGTLSFSGNLLFSGEGVSGIFNKLNESVTYKGFGDYDSETDTWDPTYRESGKETFSLTSKQGFGFSLGSADEYQPTGRIDSLAWSDKGSYTSAGKTTRFDESYKSSGSFDLTDALASDDFYTIMQALFAGDDKITASNASGSYLWGGAGADKLKGGKGYDIFSYVEASESSLNAADTILDFKSGEDTLWFEFLAEGTSVLLLDGKASFSSIQSQAADAFAQGYGVVVGSDGKQGYVLADGDGDAQADLLIKLTGVKNAASLSTDDFAFA